MNMATAIETASETVSESVDRPIRVTFSSILLALGALLFAVPTMVFVISEAWSGEEGAHGPIILLTGLWLLWREWPEARSVARAPSLAKVWALLAIFLPLYVAARVTQIVEIEGYVMYASLLAVLYSMIGGRSMGLLWFPLFYLVYIFPPPETIVAAVTTPLKMELSQVSVSFLRLLGYPIGAEGVRIYIAQYELLVAAACSGLNSIISLTAISLFYIYVRHRADWRYAAFLVLLILPVALLANFFRVIILILLTYHFGEAAAQGFLHNFAGLVMFAIALISIFGLDELLRPIWHRWVVRDNG
ncbi:MAG: exosortase V [Novosphingobium sp.]